MTKQEAIQKMRDGEKLTHTYFSSDEWVKSNQDGTILILEDGVECSPNEFWKYRQDENFNTGWEIFNK